MTRRRVNLMPREVAERARQRRRVMNAVVAGAAVLTLLVLVYAIETVRVGSAHHSLQVQQQNNAGLQSQIAQLAEFDQLERRVKEKTDLLTALTATEVRWSVLLADISLVIPSDAWLTSFSASINAVPTGGSIGTIQMNGVTFSHLEVAKWLTQLAGVREFFAPYLSLSAKGTVASTPVVDFTSSVQLSTQALRSNQPGSERQL